MHKRQRKYSRNGLTVSKLNDAARAIEKAITLAGIPASDKDVFLSWTIHRLWSTFKEERMNQRLIIENEIKGLSLRFPNGTVKKENRVSALAAHLHARRVRINLIVLYYRHIV